MCPTTRQPLESGERGHCSVPLVLVSRGHADTEDLCQQVVHEVAPTGVVVLGLREDVPEDLRMSLCDEKVRLPWPDGHEESHPTDGHGTPKAIRAMTLPAATGYRSRSQRSAGLHPLGPVLQQVNVSIPSPNTVGAFATSVMTCSMVPNVVVDAVTTFPASILSVATP